ncbi:hypothetical protein CDL15_Pgr001554 [Punica granatum]|nr:hypothetical protein CDL15_Pgr001554 [Punica granatum]PKI41634.1 hypothetical protein CRG98_037941 [Punica granatum]
MGVNTRKPEPEPGRCRRTDGKKWRCSREACLDSKYCEKHMHRGKNRSRKSVEAASSKQPPPPAIATGAANILPSSQTNYSYSNSQLLHPFFVAADDSSSSSSYQSSQPGSTLSESTPPQDVITHPLFIDPGDEKGNFRYYPGPTSAQRAFVPESSRTDDGISSQCSYKGGHHPVSRGQAPVKIESSHQQEYQNEQEQWFVLGTDFRPRSSGQITTGKEDETEKPMHHFFGK